MSKTEKLLIVLVIITIIIIIIIGLLFYLKRGRILHGIDEVGEELETTFDDTIKIVTSKNEFYTVKNCVNKFYLDYMKIYAVANNSDILIIDEEAEKSMQQDKKTNITAVYEMLDTEYIKAKQITNDNLETKLIKINESIANITNMYVSKKSNRLSIYLVEGILREKTSGNISNFKIIVKLDAQNRTFSILPNEYVQENYKNAQEGNKLEIDLQENIDINANNKYNYRNITEADYIEELVSDFKEKILYNPQIIYERLDTNYKNKKFSNSREFENYVKNNIKRYVAMKADKYGKTVLENYTQYVIIDTAGNYYIFRETAPMKYSLILDTYTIDIPEFTEKYKVSNDQEKVILNLNKFMLAINDGDYKYAYSLLADSFKRNNFPNYETFENYAKNNFFKENKFEYLKFGDEAGTYYTYTVKITNGTANENNSITKTFIILLEEGTNFKLSFNM